MVVRAARGAIVVGEDRAHAVTGEADPGHEAGRTGANDEDRHVGPVRGRYDRLHVSRSYFVVHAVR